MVDFPVDYYLSVLGQRAKTIVFVENAKMTVVGKADSLQFAKVTGSKTHDEYAALNDQISEISEKYMAHVSGIKGSNCRRRYCERTGTDG
jgi:hypothetical protein